MKNKKRFEQRLSKRHAHQVSSLRNYDSNIPDIVYFLLIAGGISVLIALLVYCCSI